jgi:hypothetical protein
MEECQSYGPEAVAKTLIAGGIGVCFAKPRAQRERPDGGLLWVDGLRWHSPTFQRSLEGRSWTYLRFLISADESYKDRLRAVFCFAHRIDWIAPDLEWRFTGVLLTEKDDVHYVGPSRPRSLGSRQESLVGGSECAPR